MVGGMTALLIASQRGRDKSVRCLLAAGADPNHLCSKGLSPLSFAIFHGHKNVVRMLLQAGADPSKVNVNGVSPLMYAVCKEQKEAALCLLEFGAVASSSELASWPKTSRARLLQWQGDHLRELTSRNAELSWNVSEGLPAWCEAAACSKTILERRQAKLNFAESPVAKCLSQSDSKKADAKRDTTVGPTKAQTLKKATRSQPEQSTGQPTKRQRT
eukprot:scaffold46202_cov47-Prasinocladus_malaysianus.AAC.1